MAGNHLYEKKPANRDEILWPEIIPGKRKQQIEMKFRPKSNPGMSVSPNKDETGTLWHDKPSPCKQKQDNKLWISVVKE